MEKCSSNQNVFIKLQSGAAAAEKAAQCKHAAHEKREKSRQESPINFFN